MITPQLPQRKTLVTDDLEELYTFIDSMRFNGDGENIVVDHDHNGVNIRYVGEATAATGDGETTNVYPAKIKSRQGGAYRVDILNESGEVIESDAPAITTLASAYDIPLSDFVVAYKVTVDTLGG